MRREYVRVRDLTESLTAIAILALACGLLQQFVGHHQPGFAVVHIKPRVIVRGPLSFDCGRNTAAASPIGEVLLDRRIESNGVLAAAKELGITLIAYSPLAQGVLSGKFHADPNLARGLSGPRKFLPNFRARGLERSRPLVDELRKIAQAHGVTPSQVALNWLTAFHGETVVVIPGASKRRQAEENAGSMGFTLSQDELRRIDELSRPFL